MRASSLLSRREKCQEANASARIELAVLQARHSAVNALTLEFWVYILGSLTLHPSSNEKALLLRSVCLHTIQAHAEKGSLTLQP